MPITFVNYVYNTDGGRTTSNLDFTGKGHQSGDIFLWHAIHSEGGAAFDCTHPKGTILSGAAGYTSGTAQRDYDGFIILDGTEGILTWTFGAASGTASLVHGVILRGVQETSFSATNYRWDVITTASATITSGALDQPANSWRVSLPSLDGGATTDNYSAITGTNPVERYDTGGVTGTFLLGAGFTEEFASAATGVTRQATATLGTNVPQAMTTFVVTPSSVGPADPALNTNAEINVDEIFRIRFRVRETGGSSSKVTSGMRPWFRKNNGAYAQVTTATELRAIANPGFADGDATTELLGGTGGAYVAGQADEDGLVAGQTITAGGRTEHDFSFKLQPGTIADGDTFNVQLRYSDGTVLETYSQTPTITANVPPTVPSIGLSTTSMTFSATEGGGNPSTRGLTVTNTGGGTLAWSVSDNASWLSVTPASGSLVGNGANEVLTVAATTGTLTAGTYNATITVSDPAATNTPQTVAVTFVVSGVTGLPVAIEGTYSETSSGGLPVMMNDGTIYIVREDAKAVPTTHIQERYHIDKSLDGGHTWIRDINYITSTTENRDLESLWVMRDPNNAHRLMMAHQKSGYNTGWNTFRTDDHPTNPDTWETDASMITGAQSGPDDQSVCFAPRSDGTVVAFYNGGNQQIQYKIRSNSETTGTWGAEVLVSDETTNAQQVYAVKSAQDNTIHIIYADRANNQVKYRTLSPTNVLSAESVLGSGVSQVLHPIVNNGAVLYNNAGVDHIYTAWSRSSDGFLMGCEIIGTTPSAAEVLSSAAVWINPPNVLSNQPVGTICFDHANGDLHVFYSLASDFDLRRRRRTIGGAWDAQTTVAEVSPNIQAVQARVYTHNATNGGSKVVGLFYDVDTGVVDEGRIEYSEVVLAAGIVTVGKDFVTPWTIRTLAGEDLATPWTIRVSAGEDLATPWTIRTKTGKDLATPWYIRAASGKDFATPWYIRAALGKDLATPWTIRLPLGRDLAAPWTIRTAAGEDLATPWMIRAAAGEDLAMPWTIRLPLGRDLATPWTIRTTAGEDVELRWDILGAMVVVGRDLAMPWTIRASVGRDLATPWTIQAALVAVGRDLATPWTIRAAVGKDASLPWTIRTSLGRDLAAPWTIRTVLGRDLAALWRIYTLAGRDLAMPWTMRSVAARDLSLLWAVGSLGPPPVVFPLISYIDPWSAAVALDSVLLSAGIDVTNTTAALDPVDFDAAVDGNISQAVFETDPRSDRSATFEPYSGDADLA